MILPKNALLDDLNVRWEEEDEGRRFFDLTAKSGEHGGLSLIPLYVKLKNRQKKAVDSRPTGA